MLRDEKLNLDFRVKSGFINRHQLILRILWFRLEPTYNPGYYWEDLPSSRGIYTLIFRDSLCCLLSSKVLTYCCKKEGGLGFSQFPIKRMSIFVEGVHL